jgi:hypothetical protein
MSKTLQFNDAVLFKFKSEYGNTPTGDTIERFKIGSRVESQLLPGGIEIIAIYEEGKRVYGNKWYISQHELADADTFLKELTSSGGTLIEDDPTNKTIHLMMSGM